MPAYFLDLSRRGRCDGAARSPEGDGRPERVHRLGEVVVQAMKTCGMILADDGSDWYVSGESNDAWEPEMDALLPQLRKVKGSDFEIVETGPVIVAPD